MIAGFGMHGNDSMLVQIQRLTLTVNRLNTNPATAKTIPIKAIRFRFDLNPYKPSAIAIIALIDDQEVIIAPIMDHEPSTIAPTAPPIAAMLRNSMAISVGAEEKNSFPIAGFGSSRLADSESF